MQTLKRLQQWVLDHSLEHRGLFEFNDLRALFPTLSDTHFRALLSRAAKYGFLARLCRGIYSYPKALQHDGLLLYRVSLLLRPGAFNYISLETVLSEVGVISQVPIDRIFIMSSGRSSVIRVGSYGVIEFVHTKQRPENLCEQLHYDAERGLWCASVSQAIRDMRVTKRNCDLIDWGVADEFI